MPAIGEHAISAAGGGVTGFEHTQNKFCFINPYDNLLYLAAPHNDVNDWFLWKRDGKGPTTGPYAGNNGEWSIAEDNLSAQINLDTRASCRPDVFFDVDNTRLTVLRPHATDPRFDQYNWDNVSKSFNLDATVQNIAVNFHADPDEPDGDHPSHVIDSTGVCHIQSLHSSSPHDMIYHFSNSARTSMTQYVTLENNVGDERDMRGDIVNWIKVIDSVPTKCIGVVYGNRNTQTLRFAWKKDSDPNELSSWTFEDAELLAFVDNHCNAVAHVMPGDQESTIFVARKAEQLGIQSVVVQRRDPLAGGWGNKVILETSDSLTRPKLCLDTYNGVLHCIYINNNQPVDYGAFYRSARVKEWDWSVPKIKCLETTAKDIILNVQSLKKTTPAFGVPIIGLNEVSSPSEVWLNFLDLPRQYPATGLVI